MIKFDPDSDFISNFEIALKELGDADLTEIFRNRINDLLNFARGNIQHRNNIINDLENLIERRVKKEGD